jgi:MFS family permease
VGAGLRAYQLVLADPRARGFTLAGLIARLPISMTGIGIVLLVSLTTGSFGRAGLITAAGTITGALVAPLWGRAMDRIGQAKVLIAAVIINTVSLAILIISVQLGWPLVVSLLASAGVGLGFSSSGAAVRARWSHRLAGSPLLNTAFAFEAMLDEVVFIVGPVLVTFLATSLHPALGIATSGALGLIGAVALAAQRGTQPPIHPGTRRRGGSHLLPVRILLPVAIACGALGMVFGGMEVVVVAFAKTSGVLKYTGVILMAWALGSLLAGAVTGTIAWKASPARRFRVGAVSLALSLLPLIFVSNPVVVAILLMVSGIAIAPTLIASVAVTQASVPSSRLTEALAWTSTGLAAGVAAGAAVLGQVIDIWGWRAGFIGVAGAGLMLIISAFFVQSHVRGRRISDLPEPISDEVGISGVQPDRRPAEPTPRRAEIRRR